MKNLIVIFIIFFCMCLQNIFSQNSDGIYRIPYANGTDIRVSRDHLTHSPVPNRLDMVGINGSEPYRIVAAQRGIIRYISDGNTVRCPDGGCPNNYVWIEHANGEWTKYSHLATGSVTGDAGLAVGNFVSMGTFLGYESDVGIASGDHLHFEVGIPNDPANPLSSLSGGFMNGVNRTPRFCELNILEANQEYTATSCGTIGNRILDVKWTEGWTTAEFYRINNETYLFLLKEKGLSNSGKNVHIHRMNNDGTVGDRIATYKWSEGWTTARFYKLRGQTFLFLLKEQGLSGVGKNVHIHRMNNDGTVGDRIATHKWSRGWTSVEFFRVGAQSFLFLLKERGLSNSGKNVHIHRMNNDGTVGDRIATYKWSEGWTTGKIYKVGVKVYLFLLKENGVSDSNKNVHIHRMNNNGTVGSRVCDYKWTEGWTVVEPFTAFGRNFLFLLKTSTGDVHLHRINNNGSVGEMLSDKRWTKGWSLSEFYRLGTASYLFLLKSSSGDVHIHNNDIFDP